MQASRRASGRAAERDPLDRFYTDPKLASCIAKQAHALAPGARSFLEPSSGECAFVQAMWEHWDLKSAERSPEMFGGVLPQITVSRSTWHIQAGDLDPSARAHAEKWEAQFHEGDFLEYKPFRQFDVVLANPPFALPPEPGRDRGKPIAAKHVEHMLEMVAEGGVCAVLIRQSFIATKDRFKLFDKYTPKLVDILVQRPSFTQDGATDQHEYAVIYWQRMSRLRFARRGSTRMRWLNWK